MDPAKSCLRPDFTLRLSEQLAAGAALMLTSSHGQGRRRTLADLRDCLPPAMRILQANLRDHPASLSALLTALAEQAGLPAPASPASLLATLADHEEPTLIILHNFDELQPGAASGFDTHFFEILNGIGDHDGLALLCVCVHQQGGLPLHISPLPLPALTAEQISAELTRRGLAQEETVRHAEALSQRPAPYSAIEHMAAERPA